MPMTFVSPPSCSLGPDKLSQEVGPSGRGAETLLLYASSNPSTAHPAMYCPSSGVISFLVGSYLTEDHSSISVLQGPRSALTRFDRSAGQCSSSSRDPRLRGLFTQPRGRGVSEGCTPAPHGRSIGSTGSFWDSLAVFAERNLERTLSREEMERMPTITCDSQTPR
jgi:hypothetical protein